MALVTVVGPLNSEADAHATAACLGSAQHSVFSREVTDADGYGTGEHQWFVERDDSIVPDRIFGYAWADIQAKQQRK